MDNFAQALAGLAEAFVAVAKDMGRVSEALLFVELIETEISWRLNRMVRRSERRRILHDCRRRAGTR